MVTKQPPIDEDVPGRKHRLGKLDKARAKGKLMQKQLAEDGITTISRQSGIVNIPSTTTKGDQNG
jgi:hypothetical protein